MAYGGAFASMLRVLRILYSEAKSSRFVCMAGSALKPPSYVRVLLMVMLPLGPHFVKLYLAHPC